MILLPNRTVSPEYLWMRTLHVPVKLINGITDISEYVCATGSTKPVIIGDTLFGRLPGRKGYMNYYKSDEGVWDQCVDNPNVLYYWVRERPSKGYIKPNMPTMFNRGRCNSDEPWHKWNEKKIASKIIAICKDLCYSVEPVDIICMSHGLNHWGFRELFQSRYPEHYIAFQKYQTIPTESGLASEFTRRFPTLSLVTE